MNESAEVSRFAEHAREFVAWCHTDHDGKASKVFKVEALKQLAVLYCAGLNLPKVEFKPAPEEPRVTDVQRQVVAQNLSPLPFQYYWDICEEAIPDKDNEPGCGDLFDDFQEIYADISSGLWLYDGGHVEAAGFSWRQMFNVHWGNHAVAAMHALHSFDFDE